MEEPLLYYDPRSRTSARSPGLKLIFVGGLALLMTIPSFFVMGLVSDRTGRAQDVVQEISTYSGGQQTFLGPTLLVPRKTAAACGLTLSNAHVIFPTEATGALKTITEERRRSLFKVPVFRSEVGLDASFDLTGGTGAVSRAGELDWSCAEIVVGVSDARGALADATITANGKTAVLTPVELGPDPASGERNGRVKLILLGTPFSAVATPDSKFTVSSSLRFSGAQRIAVLSYGKTTRLSASGDWPNPGFDGGFLPMRRAVSQSGFSAEWAVPFIARGVPAEGLVDSLAALGTTALGISFVEVADPYQSVTRSLKYVLLFVGLVFLCYFLFEVATGTRVHPAQYVLVGVAQIIFYLLLLSLSERIGFDWGFLVAGSSTVALLSANAAWVFASRMLGMRALAMFSTLYVVIYVLLRMEDNALLVGAIASFVAVGAAMYFTRRIDWYGSLTASPRPPGGESNA